jgi:hypothetical protein
MKRTGLLRNTILPEENDRGMIKGFYAGIFGNRVRGNFRGIAITGGINEIDYDCKGMVVGTANSMGYFKGFSFSLLSTEIILNPNGGDKSINVAGLGIRGYKFNGANFAGVGSFVERDSKGVNISGVLNTGEGIVSNIISSRYHNHSESSGFNIAGFGNFFNNYTCKGFQGAGVYNSARYVKEYLFQIGAFNRIEVVDDDAFTLQIGLYSKAGNQSLPLVNVRGLSFLGRKIKSKFKKQRLEERVTI